MMAAESVQPDIDPRTIRAATEHMTVIEEARSLFEVTSESGSSYTVDLREPACTCPDFHHRTDVEECKHIRRVRLEVGQIDTTRLRDEIASTATDLETEAERLEAHADNLFETAEKLRTALTRLREVTEE